MKSVISVVFLPVILPACCFLLCFAPTYAQHTEPEVRIKIQQNINGQVTEIDTVLRGGNADVNDLMRNFNLNLQMPGLQNEIPDDPDGFLPDNQSGGLADKSHQRTRKQYDSQNESQQLNQSSNEASLGIVVDANEANDDDEGVKIARVIDGSAAQKAGLQPGDLIMSIDGKELYASEDLVNEVKSRKAGDEVTITYIRNGKRTQTKAVLQQPDFEDFLQQQGLDDFFNPDIWNNDQNFNAWTDELDRFRRLMEEQMQRWGTQDNELNDHWNDFDAPFNAPPPQDHYEETKPETELQPEKLSLAADATQKTFNLSFSLAQSGSATVRILDAMGNIMFEDKPSRFPGSYQKSVTLKTQSFAGTYFLQIVQNGKMYHKKITVY